MIILENSCPPMGTSVRADLEELLLEVSRGRDLPPGPCSSSSMKTLEGSALGLH